MEIYIRSKCGQFTLYITKCLVFQLLNHPPCLLNQFKQLILLIVLLRVKLTLKGRFSKALSVLAISEV